MLQETLGDDRAWAALGTSKAQIKEACKGMPRGRGWAFIERQLEAAGAVEVVHVPRVKKCDALEQGGDGNEQW